MGNGRCRTTLLLALVAVMVVSSRVGRLGRCPSGGARSRPPSPAVQLSRVQRVELGIGMMNGIMTCGAASTRIPDASSAAVMP